MVCLLFLAAGSWKDWKNREIPLSLLGAGGSIGIAMELWKWHAGDGGWNTALLGLLPGFLLLGLGRTTGEAVGYGDGLAVLTAGIYLGFWDTVETVLCGCLLSAVWAVWLLAVKKKDKKDRFPFLPFLCLGLAVRLLYRMLSG